MRARVRARWSGAPLAARPADCLPRVDPCERTTMWPVHSRKQAAPRNRAAPCAHGLFSLSWTGRFFCVAACGRTVCHARAPARPPRFPPPRSLPHCHAGMGWGGSPVCKPTRFRNERDFLEGEACQKKREVCARAFIFGASFHLPTSSSSLLSLIPCSRSLSLSLSRRPRGKPLLKMPHTTLSLISIARHPARARAPTPTLTPLPPPPPWPPRPRARAQSKGGPSPPPPSAAPRGRT